MSQEIISDVFEYSGQFTKNVTQVRKAWNDGKVTYFKLNRKIQVHTEDGHLIAEKFLEKALVKMLEDESRYGEEFRVGSVLVRVEEMVAMGQRDVARIFKKQKLQPVQRENISPTTRPLAPIPIIQRKPIIGTATKFSSTPLTLSGTVRRRKVGLSRLQTPSKQARPLETEQQESDESLSPPNESPSSQSQERHRRSHAPVASNSKVTNDKSPAKVLPPKTPGLLNRPSLAGPMARVTPSKYTPVPLSTRVSITEHMHQNPVISERSRSSSPEEPSPLSQQNKRNQQATSIITDPLPFIKVTRPSPKLLISRSVNTAPTSENRTKLVNDRATPSKPVRLSLPKKAATTPTAPVTRQTGQHSSTSSLLQQLSEQDEEPIISINKYSTSPVTNTSNIAVKPEPSTIPMEPIPPMDDIVISWGTQDNVTSLTERIISLHQQSLQSADTPSIDPPPPPRLPLASLARTPRPRIGHRTREIIRVEQPTPRRTPNPTTSVMAQRTPLQKLQSNTSMKTAHTPVSNNASLNLKKLQNLRFDESNNGGLATPVSVKSKVKVYVSDSEEDVIVETQIPTRVESQGKITQTETYNYGGEGHRISNMRI